MKTVLCYGDSNTYGYNPVNGLRYPKNVRWTGKLQERLGDQFLVIEEGCNGRTTMFDDPTDPWKNGLRHLKPCLNTHKPVDMVIIMLGSNDLKNMYQASIDMIAKGAEELVKEVYSFSKAKQCIKPDVILVAPPIIGEGICDSVFNERFDETAITRSLQFSGKYCEVAKRQGCIFFDAAQYAKSSKVDCLHLMPEDHEKLAQGLSEFILEYYTGREEVHSKRLVMKPYSLEEMIELQQREPDMEMKKAYGEMIDCMQKNPGEEYWGVAWEISLNGERVGDVCFKGAPGKNGIVEIGYGIDEEMQGKGYATEMVAAMVHWAFGHEEVKCVMAETEENNVASQKVLIKNGFREDGIGVEGPRFVLQL